MHQARPIIWCLESKEVTSSALWDRSHGTPTPRWTSLGTPLWVDQLGYPTTKGPGMEGPDWEGLLEEPGREGLMWNIGVHRYAQPHMCTKHYYN